MSFNFHANQFEKEYRSSCLGNWETPKGKARHPKAPTGPTKILANDRGHLLLGVARSKRSPWGDFQGTWQVSRYKEKKPEKGKAGNDNCKDDSNKKDSDTKKKETGPNPNTCNQQQQQHQQFHQQQQQQYQQQQQQFHQQQQQFHQQQQQQFQQQQQQFQQQQHQQRPCCC